MIQNERIHIRAWFEVMRPHQWVKNSFVLVAPVFGRQIFNAEAMLPTLLGFVLFCMASSAAYIINDILDARRDRLHPLKRNRPVASRQMSVTEAGGLAAVLIIFVAGFSAVLLPWTAFVTIMFYIVFNLLYSLYLKHIVILDVMCIAVGFILRVFMGAFCASVEPSYWLLLCTLNVSLFLGFTKRRSEVMALESKAVHHREVLEHYSLGFLDQMIAIVTGATLVCYILYTVDKRTSEIFGTHYLVATVPFVIYGVFRYLYLCYHKNGGDNPTKTILNDVPFCINLVLWGIACVIAIYMGSYLAGFMPW